MKKIVNFLISLILSVAGAATYTPTSTSTGPPGQTSYSNQTYFTPVTRTVIPNQAYIQGQQTQPAMPMNQTYVQKQIPWELNERNTNSNISGYEHQSLSPQVF